MATDRKPGEPILVSEGSRRAMRRYLTTNDDTHEIIADAVRAAEVATIEAVLKALEVEKAAQLWPQRLVLPRRDYDADRLFRDIEANLGRAL